jgi:phosphopantetheinyl transferase (holo-ACP synthase)
MRIRPFVEIVALRETSLTRGAIESASFDPRESAPALSVRTLAGFLCVKKTVVAAACFIRNASGGGGCTEKDIIVGHDRLGAPRILEMPTRVQSRLRHICVSISHTANYACGCAVIEEETSDV